MTAHLEPASPLTARSAGRRLGADAFLVVSWTTSVVFLVWGERLWATMAAPLALTAILAWLFAAVLGSALAVVRHAEALAERLGEPYGTLILTLAVTVIEVVSISAVMLHGEANPTLARDTLFAVVMIILNGMVGASLLIGGWRHREQSYNLQGANAYLSATIPLIVLSLALPTFTTTTPGPTLSFMQETFLVVVSLGLYAVFLTLQTGRHRDYFAAPLESSAAATGTTEAQREHAPRPSIARSVALLAAHLLPALFMAEQQSRPIDYLIETLHAPTAFGGVILAVLVATPEALGAVRAAFANRLQRSINIFLGSILSTIGITIPAMVIISDFTGQTLILGVQHADMVLLLLTLTVSIITFSSGRTNVIQGIVHLILFAAYLMLIVQG